MGSRLAELLLRHFRNHSWLYLAIIACFFLGLASGVLALFSLNATRNRELADYFNLFWSGLAGWQIDLQVLAGHTIFKNLETILFLWFLGLTVVGAPLILALIFLKGFALGFTMGFLIQEKALAGFLVAFLSVFPQSLFNVPALVMGGVAAVSFSAWLAGGRNRSGSLASHLAAYSLFMLAMAGLGIGGGLIEAYFSPLMLRLVAAYF